jgi:hypothetical protein
MRDIIQGRLMEEKFEYTKGKSEAIIRRRTDNAMPKIKRTKGQTTIYKIQHRKLKIEEYEPN